MKGLLPAPIVAPEPLNHPLSLAETRCGHREGRRTPKEGP